MLNVGKPSLEALPFPFIISPVTFICYNINMDVKIHESWQSVLGEYFETPEFKELSEQVRADYIDESKTVYPAPADLFRAFNSTHFDDVQVVILGQDPYHNPGEAHGLCFSVPEGVLTPPSLQNIFKEIQSDVGRTDTSTDLTRWANQGVFLLNAVLSVLRNQPTSHAGIGWEDFTDHVIKTISDEREHIVFLLWGAYARSKVDLIDWSKHLVLEAPHPSPLSAHRGFFGCKHFSQANEYLKSHGKKEIDW
jgi:uracil-DNA glycosylase